MSKRILVIGGGLIGARHIRAVQAHPDCQLVGVVDPDPAVKAPDGIPKFDNLNEVSAPVDGAIIATPTPLHEAQAAAAASRGWHMLIEKPVTDDLAAASRVAQTVKDAGVRALVGHHRRYHPSLARLSKWLRTGRIGAPVTATLIWAMRKPDAYFENNWRSAGGSPVLINLIHDLDMLRFLFGNIAQIAALHGKPQRGTGLVESGAVALTFESGVAATISFADTAPSAWGFEAGTAENPNIAATGQDMMWITGSSGGVSFPSLSLWGKATDWSQPAQLLQQEPGLNSLDILHAQLSHFVEVLNGSAPLVTVQDATKTLAAALDIQKQLEAQLNIEGAA